MGFNRLVATLVFCAAPLFSALADGSLTDNIRIKSDILGYDLQYRVYVPDGVKADAKLPTLYVTDGQWYLGQGELDTVLDREIAAGNIDPVIAIFVDNRNPDKLDENRRNSQFFCRPDYIGFYTDELIPHIDKTYATSGQREDRVILGLSFGGLNSACFGLMASEAFKGIAMQSPANDKLIRMVSNLYSESSKRPIRIFMSVGTKNDNTMADRRLKRTLINKGYDLTYLEVAEGHNWNNWGPLLDDVLVTFFAKNPASME